MTTLYVKEVSLISPGVFELQLHRGGVAFTPGDCMGLYDESGISRPYSIASGSGEDVLRFLVRRIEGGRVSGFLAGLQAGAALQVSPPFGWFRPGETAGEAPFAFCATGTGIDCRAAPK